LSPSEHGLFELELFNIINEKQIYRIKINDCYYYFYRNDMNYLLFMNENDYILIKFEDSLPNLISEEINEIESILNSTLKYIHKLGKLRTKKILLLKTENCHIEISLLKTQEKIEELNARLSEICGNLKLELNYLYNMHVPNSKLSAYHRNPNPTSLLLCLNNNSGCVSSIMIMIDFHEKQLSIDSFTDTSVRSKKYNKLLRAVIIIISTLLYQKIENITSLALNIISAYLFIKHFNGIIPHDYADVNKRFFEFLREKGITLSNETNYMDLFNEYEKNESYFLLFVQIPTTPANIENAEDKFQEILSEITC